ncbi:MAG: hypothetical protein KC912_17930 [Proteobacteria bacterium]|nr:hypothetical protein [Pseudomonadota bacterium]
MADKRAVYGKLGEARKARQAGDLDGAAAALQRAIELARLAKEDKLLNTASWRLADLFRDSDRPEEMLASLDDVVAHGKPFAHLKGGKAFHVANDTIRKYWDFAGYATDRILPLLGAVKAHYEAHSDPYMAALADELSSWQMACRGDLAGMTALIDRYDGMTPSQFGSGSHRHTRASPGNQSVYWVQMEIARTALRMAAWMGDEALGRRAHEMHAVALKKANVSRHEFLNLMEATMVAGLELGWEEVLEECRADYDKAMRDWSGGREDYHKAVYKAVGFALAGQQSEAADAWRDAATVSDEMHYGPEWVGDYLLRAAAAASACGRTEEGKRWHAQAAEVIDEYGFDAMRGRLA